MKLTFEQRPNYLSVQVTGRFSLADATSSFEQILQACKRTGDNTALVDITQLALGDSATLRVLFAASARERYLRYLAEGGQRLRIAFVAGASNFMSWRPGIQLAKNMEVAIFIHEAEAKAWLDV